MNAAAARATTEVAVGVLVRADGSVLLADRPAGKPYAGYWEFPGGKIEPGETIERALARELHEELGVDIGAAPPWFVFEYDYPHAYVRLHFRRVMQWRGEPHAREGQRLGFFRADGELPQPLLPAAVPALRSVGLPSVYALSAAERLGPAQFLARLESRLAQGLRLLQIREPALAPAVVAKLVEAAAARCHARGARVLLSSRHHDVPQAGCDGVHLTSAHLMAATQRPAGDWIAASVHNADELAQAARIGCDFVVAGPVMPTASHPHAPTLGWHGFSALAAQTPVPMFALGGLLAADLQRAQQAGAHGVALLSGAWLPD